jgi:hypothetical protein
MANKNKLSKLFNEENLKLDPRILLHALKNSGGGPQFFDAEGKKVNKVLLKFSTAEAKRGAELLADQYNKTSDPIAALVALRISLKHRIPVPAAVSQWLLSGLHAYASDSSGDMTLDKALGLNARRGTATPLAKAQELSAIQPLMNGMAQAIGMFGVSIEDAAEMVAAKTEKESVSYTAGTLARYYRGKHGEHCRGFEFIHSFFSTADEKEQYMQTFPNKIITKYDKLSWE